MASDDPDFETKAADIIEPYLDAPARAAVFCVDEKAAIQALAGWTRYCRCRQVTPSARIRVLPPRHSVTACRLQHQIWQSPGQAR